MVPFMQKKVYQKILMSMVSLAVGVLGGSGIFHLIPSVSLTIKLFLPGIYHKWKSYKENE